MAFPTATELRAQGAHARHLADEMSNQEAQAELRQIADALDAQAEELEQIESLTPTPPIART